MTRGALGADGEGNCCTRLNSKSATSREPAVHLLKWFFLFRGFSYENIWMIYAYPWVPLLFRKASYIIYIYIYTYIYTYIYIYPLVKNIHKKTIERMGAIDSGFIKLMVIFQRLLLWLRPWGHFLVHFSPTSNAMLRLVTFQGEHMMTIRWITHKKRWKITMWKQLHHL